MIDDEPRPASYYDDHDIWTLDPTPADKRVYESFATGVVDLVQQLDDNKPQLSRDVYARFFACLLSLSRVLGKYEDGWKPDFRTSDRP